MIQISNGKRLYDLRKVAEIINIKKVGRNNLCDYLRSIGVFDEKNCPKDEYLAVGYFEVIKGVSSIYGRYSKPLLTETGLKWLLDNHTGKIY